MQADMVGLLFVKKSVRWDYGEKGCTLENMISLKYFTFKFDIFWAALAEMEYLMVLTKRGRILVNTRHEV